ncbi:MAG: low molecular weight phosphotyrosine protein phosphatase [Candidatus Eisenbacteria bacterium]|uniref:Low molecular weight phosphotyrosine protein phosphatase n=1 Tax=Eiseniibacteriota bacterium TaxID=2212470 RepID=A0A933W1B8_UNCEI|nr:low molecular weight phosphotyrosine protein phosphatase [Candidatus Eisenbacteria bacterium]
MPPDENIVRVLFVCTGNTCRSPLAAAALLAELGDDAARAQVVSAGTAAAEGQPASALSRAVAEAEGIDLSRHRSRRAVAPLVRAADFVFVMEPLHRVAIEALGAPRERVHLLSEYPAPGEPGMPVSDPFGASKEAYEECWRRIRHHVRRLTPAVRQALNARNAS